MVSDAVSYFSNAFRKRNQVGPRNETFSLRGRLDCNG